MKPKPFESQLNKDQFTPKKPPIGKKRKVRKYRDSTMREREELNTPTKKKNSYRQET